MRFLLALSIVTSFALAACQAPAEPAAPAAPEAPQAPVTPDAPAAGASDLVGRAWSSTDADAAPGTLLIFLADGRVFNTSCVETYRLDAWQADGDGRLTIQEETVAIPVAYTVSGDALTLQKTLVDGGVKEEHYRPAQAPFVCSELR